MVFLIVCRDFRLAELQTLMKRGLEQGNRGCFSRDRRVAILSGSGRDLQCGAQLRRPRSRLSGVVGRRSGRDIEEVGSRSTASKLHQDHDDEDEDEEESNGGNDELVAVGSAVAAAIAATFWIDLGDMAVVEWQRWL
ncbi:hypothetical protein L2E82_16812 [Cichorium intybus]|uniref:Uncharacterized protein n=1 Tax=Cichorium intybus TaxID=13427 RepID=A0ACB9F767_CICIN|nr:hypothetical protein L2E82_16812 [Cichorium intybus]